MKTRKIVGIEVQGVKGYCNPLPYVKGEPQKFLPDVEVRRTFKITKADGDVYAVEVEEDANEVINGVHVLCGGTTKWCIEYDGTTWKTIKNGIEVPYTNAISIRDWCFNTILSEVWGEEYTGYEHNYRCENGESVQDW